jgi:hypothetical protein
MKSWPRKWKLFASHGAVFSVAAVVALIEFRDMENTSGYITDSLARQVQSLPASLSFAIGSRTDAIAMLDGYITALEQQNSTDRLVLTDLDLARFRRAAVANAPREELERLCAQSHKKCRPESIDRIVKALLCLRKVTDAPP